MHFRKKNEFHLMSAPCVNFISKFLGAEVVRGRRLKDGTLIAEKERTESY